MAENGTKWNTHKKALLDALKNCMGNVSEACELTGLGRTTYYRYCNEDPEFKTAVDAIEESNLDFAEGQLKKLMKGVELEETQFFMYRGKIVAQNTIKKFAPDKAAIIFYLKTKGKKRGYIERSEHINRNLNDDPFKDMTEEEIDAYMAEIEAEDKAKQKAPEVEPRDHYNEEE